MDIGKRIRKLRRQQDFTLQEIADKCGFTKSLLSKIENNVISPPVSTLSKIADALGVKIAAFFDEQGHSGPLLVTAEEINSGKLTKTDKGYFFYAYAAQKQNKAMQPFYFVIRKNEVKRQALSHVGEEFIYVLEGRMKYRIGNIEYTLKTGDGLYFDASDKHDFEAITNEVRYISVFTEGGRA